MPIDAFSPPGVPSTLLRIGATITHPACGFAVSVTTAWRYVREAIDLLAAHADDLNSAMRRISRLAYAILDGTLIPIDRVADQRPRYSGKHKRHGVNVQIITGCEGRLVWTSPALPGAVHNAPSPTLKDWKALAELRCCPRRAAAILQAILVLHHVQSD